MKLDFAIAGRGIDHEIGRFQFLADGRAEFCCQLLGTGDEVGIGPAGQSFVEFLIFVQAALRYAFKDLPARAEDSFEQSLARGAACPLSQFVHHVGFTHLKQLL